MKPHPVGDWKARREMVTGMFAALAPPDNIPKDVAVKEFTTKSYDGAEIGLRWYEKQGSKPGSAILYTHGGGMIAGSAEIYESVVGNYTHLSGVPILSVDYRLAPEHPAPTPVEDAYAGLVWLHDHAKEFGIDPSRIAVMGDSAGGGIAAGLTHLVKEKGGPALAKQILIYPMLDDRNIQHDEQIGQFAVWSGADNETGWGALLGERRGNEGVPPKDAPARMTDATGLPPMYVDAGELDIFRDEILEYVRKFGKAGISVELHLFPGCPHAFEAFAPNSKFGKAAFQGRVNAMTSV